MRTERKSYKFYRLRLPPLGIALYCNLTFTVNWRRELHRQGKLTVTWL